MATRVSDGGVIREGKYCSGCGVGLHVSAPICPHCGAPQRGAAVGQKSRIAAALLALFLGGLGVHKFYLGQIGWGFIYLLFCWTFIPSVIAFIEFIVYLCMSDEAFAAKYG
jgi:TM2 domain-containing membrane protein YozV